MASKKCFKCSGWVQLSKAVHNANDGSYCHAEGQCPHKIDGKAAIAKSLKDKVVLEEKKREREAVAAYLTESSLPTLQAIDAERESITQHFIGRLGTDKELSSAVALGESETIELYEAHMRDRSKDIAAAARKTITSAEEGVEDSDSDGGEGRTLAI